MPYSNIVYVKLFLDLFFGDNRFRFLYKLSDRQQLLYIKLLALAGSTQNSIPDDLEYISHTINYKGTISDLKEDLMAIEENFPKLHNGNGCYQFENFEELHNYISAKRKASVKVSEPDKKKPVKKTKAIKAEPNPEAVKLFEVIWKNYPKPIGKQAALKSFRASVKTKEDFDAIKKALETYKRSERVMNGYIQNGRTWFANWRDWTSYSETVCPTCKNTGKYKSVTPRGSYENICKCPAGEKFK
jgi:hypothetical protein